MVGVVIGSVDRPRLLLGQPDACGRHAAGKATPLVLSDQIAVLGEAVTKPVPAASSAAESTAIPTLNTGSPASARRAR